MQQLNCSLIQEFLIHHEFLVRRVLVQEMGFLMFVHSEMFYCDVYCAVVPDLIFKIF